MWQEFAELLPRIWTQEEITYDGEYFQIPRREVLPKRCSARTRPYGRRAAATRRRRLTGSLGMGGLFGSGRRAQPASAS